MMNAKYQVLVDCMAQSAVPFGLIGAPTPRLLSANDALQRLLRLHMIATSVDLFRHGEALHDCIAACVQTGTQQLYRDPGLSHQLELTPLPDEQGQVTLIQCIATLPEAPPPPQAEARFQRIVDEFPHSVWLFSSVGELFWNNQASDRFTYGKTGVQDFSNLRWLDKVHPDDIERLNLLFTQAVVTKQPSVGGRWRMRDHTGKFQWFEVTACPMRDDKGRVEYWLGVSVNITDLHEQQVEMQARIDRSEQRHLEDTQRLVQAQNLIAQTQKMEVVSSLAGGVAHDLNNLLFVMGLYTDLLAGSKDDSSRREHLKTVRDSIRKAARLSNQLMSFSGRKPQSVALIEARELVLGIEDILRQAVGSEATLVLHVAEDAGAVSADRTYLENALINLVINARDAVSGTGRVQINVNSQSIMHNGEDQHFVMFEVCDNGAGMSPEVQARIFEPFFTTKALGKGTGLGLPMVLNFAQSSGGFVDVKSVQGEGSCISIHLPSAVGATDAEEAPTELQLPGGKESILLVEDDLAVRDALATILYQLGYTVTTAFNPLSAMRFLLGGLQVDLIISDVRMPGKMTVLDFVHELEQRQMDIPVIFATAYSADIVVKEGLIDGKHPVLFKPFSTHELADMIATLLRKSAGS